MLNFANNEGRFATLVEINEIGGAIKAIAIAVFNKGQISQISACKNDSEMRNIQVKVGKRVIKLIIHKNAHARNTQNIRKITKNEQKNDH